MHGLPIRAQHAPLSLSTRLFYFSLTAMLWLEHKLAGRHFSNRTAQLTRQALLKNMFLFQRDPTFPTPQRCERRIRFEKDGRSGNGGRRWPSAKCRVLCFALAPQAATLRCSGDRGKAWRSNGEEEEGSHGNSRRHIHASEQKITKRTCVGFLCGARAKTARHPKQLCRHMRKSLCKCMQYVDSLVECDKLVRQDFYEGSSRVCHKQKRPWFVYVDLFEKPI